MPEMQGGEVFTDIWRGRGDDEPCFSERHARQVAEEAGLVLLGFYTKANPEEAASVYAAAEAATIDRNPALLGTVDPAGIEDAKIRHREAAHRAALGIVRHGGIVIRLAVKQEEGSQDVPPPMYWQIENFRTAFVG